MFDHGQNLQAIRKKIYPQHKKSDREELNQIICESLGFENESEFTKVSEERDKRAAEEWNDPEKADMIKNLFEIGYRLEDIRDNVFPQMKHVRRGLTDQIILSVLKCDNWEEYETARKRIYSKKRRKMQSSTGWQEAKKKSLERDGSRCTVTHKKTNLEVHHIDGDFTNNELDNLVILNKDVHIAVTFGVNGMTEEELKHWEYYKPKYVKFVRKRISYLQIFAQILRGMGYFDAKVERQLIKGKYRWIAVKKATNSHVEPGTDPLEKKGKFDEEPFHDLISKLDNKTN